ncbi:MAG: aquaporin [Chloroflexia bacterium]
MDTITSRDWSKVIAEVVGTFFFFFIGIGSGLFAGSAGVLYVALAHGIALAVAISALGHISGGHFNPAVTISLLVARKITPILGALYIVGQIVGGVLACLALLVAVPGASASLANSAPNPAAGVDFLPALVMEIVLTFFLVLVVFGTAVDNRAAKIGGFGIGLTVFVDILVGGPVSGGVMNPARAFSPYLVFGPYNGNILIYWIGPIIGGVLASLLYSTLFLPVEVADTPQQPPASEPGLLKRG